MPEHRREARARRRAARVNKRLKRDVPLLIATGAEQLITTSEAAEQIARHDLAIQQHFARLVAHRERTAARAELMRAMVAQLVDDAELQALGEQRRIYPPSPEYSADHWGRQLRRLAPALATEHGYPPIPISMPVNRHGGHAMLRRGGDDAERLRAFLSDLDAAAKARAGGEQLDLLNPQYQQEQETAMLAGGAKKFTLSVDGFTWEEIERMLFDSVVQARCTHCGHEYEVEPDAEGYDCHSLCQARSTVTSPLIKLDLL